MTLTSRLKNNKCPGDQFPLRQSLLDDAYKCTREDCTFSITTETFMRLTKGLYTPTERHRRGHEDNLAALNNHGRKVMSKDYSDAKTRS